MTDVQPMSPRIAALESELRAGRRDALDRFWQAVAAEGTPLVEPAADGESDVLVTFVWRASGRTENVRVVSGDVLGKTAAENAMTQLLDTDLWYRTYRLPSDLRFEYLLGPNDPEVAERPTESWREQSASWQIDPLNPKHYELPDDGEHPEWEEFFGRWSSWVRRTNSLVELPHAPAQPWTKRRPGVREGRVEKHRFDSSILGNSRAVYVYTPAGYEAAEETSGLLLLFDGWVYREIIPVPVILDNLIEDGRVAPLVAVMVDLPSLLERGAELSFESLEAPFLKLVTHELLPWIQRTFSVSDDPARRIIGGASNGADIAALIALRNPELFGNVLSQSGTYGRRLAGEAEPEWVARHVAESPAVPLRFYLDVGVLETQPRASSGLSILLVNRHLRTVLRAKGYDLRYEEFSGGHQPLCWQGTIADALSWLAAPGDRTRTADLGSPERQLSRVGAG